MGFREDIAAITDLLPKAPQRQTFLFSATVSREIQQVARATLARNHKFINCVTNDAPPVHAHIPQYHTLLPGPEDQIPHILRLLAHDQLTHPKSSKTMVFLPTTRLTQLFSTMLRELSGGTLPNGRRTKIYEMHSKRSQEQRTKTSEQFRRDRSPASILVTSDVSARGIDYPGVTRVIQVGIPGSSEQYIHRVGRTGRGRETVGRADLVLLPWEVGFVTWKLTDIPLKPLTITELKSQVAALAEEHDPHTHLPYGPVFERLEERIQTFLPELEESACRDCFMASIGYYLGRSGDLRVQPSIILEGLKQWAVKSLGLPTPPYVSETFLQRIGAGKEKKFARSNRDYREGKNVWEGRGRVKPRRDDERNSFGMKPKAWGEYRREYGEYIDRTEPVPQKFGLSREKRWESKGARDSESGEANEFDEKRPRRFSNYKNDGDNEFDGERQSRRRPSRYEEDGDSDSRPRRRFSNDRNDRRGGDRDGGRPSFGNRSSRYGDRDGDRDHDSKRSYE